MDESDTVVGNEHIIWGCFTDTQRRGQWAQNNGSSEVIFIYLFIYIYLFICDVYTGNPIQQRWFKRRPVYMHCTHILHIS